MAKRAAEEAQLHSLVVDAESIPPSVRNFLRFSELSNKIRGGAGSLAFAASGWISYTSGIGLVTSAGRAAVGGLVGYLVGWWLWLLVARSMRRDAIVALTRLRDESRSA